MGGLTATSLWQGTQACEVSSFAGRWRHPAPDQYVFIVQYFTMEQISSLPTGLSAENAKYDHEQPCQVCVGRSTAVSAIPRSIHAFCDWEGDFSHCPVTAHPTDPDVCSCLQCPFFSVLLKDCIHMYIDTFLNLYTYASPHVWAHGVA